MIYLGIAACAAGRLCGLLCEGSDAFDGISVAWIKRSPWDGGGLSLTKQGFTVVVG